MKYKLFFLLVVALICFSSNTQAQQPQPTPQKILKLASVEFKGLQKLKPEKLIEELGLQIGQVITPELMDEAAQRLSESGRFGNINYRFRTSGEQAFVTFEVEEVKTTAPVVFDNFIWFTDEDLWIGVKKDIPSFDGTASETGDETERIRKSLERLLKDKKIEGQVEYNPYRDESGRNPKHIFKVKGVQITPCRLRFSNAIAVSEKDLINNSQDLLKGEYSRSFIEQYANATLKPLYRKIGHLRAKFTDIIAQPADETVCKGVIVSMKVDEGVAYNWNGAVWANNQTLTAKDLDAAFGMKTGEVADGLKIDSGFVEVKKGYSQKGYLMVGFKAEADFDDDGKKVIYHINVSEGMQFKMGTLTIKGLPDDVVSRLQETWKLKAGTVYDAFYLEEFSREVLARETSVIGLIRNNKKIRQHTTVKPDVKTATVDVTIEFKE